MSRADSLATLIILGAAIGATVGAVLHTPRLRNNHDR